MSKGKIHKVLDENLKEVEKLNQDYKNSEHELNNLKIDFLKEIDLEKNSKHQFDKDLHYDEKIAIAKKMVEIGKRQEIIIERKQQIFSFIENEVLDSPGNSPFELENFGGRRTRRSRRRSRKRSRRSRR